MNGHLGLQQKQPAHRQAQKRHLVQDRNRPTIGYQAQAGATLQESPLIARQAVLAQVISPFDAERALVVEVFPIGLDERKWFFGFPTPRELVRRVVVSV
jgi:hypothetical protein